MTSRIESITASVFSVLSHDARARQATAIVRGKESEGFVLGGRFYFSIGEQAYAAAIDLVSDLVLSPAADVGLDA